jgi:hypothetical protein
LALGKVMARVTSGAQRLIVVERSRGIAKMVSVLRELTVAMLTHRMEREKLLPHRSMPAVISALR